MLSAVTDGSDFPHPKKQHEDIRSNVIYTGPGSDVQDFGERFIRFDFYGDMPPSNGVAFRIGMHFYPWTCPSTGTAGWTIEPAGDDGFFRQDPALCGTILEDNSSYVPTSGVDSLKVVFELLGDCDDFGQENCTGPQETNMSPYWDNIQVGFSPGATNAPLLGGDIIFQDGYPQGNRLEANATCNVDGTLDASLDNDPTNADLSDSAVVTASIAPNVEVHLWFKVWPGPALDGSVDAWWTKYGADSRVDFVSARMDTAEQDTGEQNGLYATFLHENDPTFDAGAGDYADVNEILPDGFFTPGTTIRYFFTSNFTSSPGQTDVYPDTTGDFLFEWDGLPSYREMNTELGTTILTPCFLYIDAFNAGVQVPVEDNGLRPYLGTTTDINSRERDNWDRYDYFGAGSNRAAPWARESNGNNGCTKYQSMIYRTIYYNTGPLSQRGLRDGDADQLINFLINDDFDRWDFAKGLWLSGNGMATILSQPDRPIANALLATYMKAQVLNDGDAYRDVTGDSSFCVRIDRVGSADPGSEPDYAALRGNGCPELRAFQILGEVDAGAGNLRYVDQDGGGAATDFAAISNDQSAGAGNPANFRTVIDAFSTHYLRRVADGWAGSDCSDDSSAITQRVSDVLTWFQTGTGLCNPAEIITGVEDGGLAPQIARTMLFTSAPNPFNPATTVRYQLADKAHVRLQLFDVSGKLVRTLVDEVQTPDQYRIEWDGSSEAGKAVSSGVYWARLSTSSGFSGSTKMVILK
jgi:hypothetical protein